MKVLPLALCLTAACFCAAPVLANPVNPTVVNGSASFSQSGNVLTVTNSSGAIINWDKFNIAAGETTRFNQVSASSSVLNRVLGDPSVIYGTLSSNGRVWLVNPAGILIGAGARVDVAGFVASTLNVRNDDFLAGRHIFTNDGVASDVVNQGEIRTPSGGSVYLIGANVANEGLIAVPTGQAILAAGTTVSLTDPATPAVKVDITGNTGNSTNLGTITAEAGSIGMVGVIVRNSGLLDASSAAAEGGSVFLKASQDTYVEGNGRIVTTGTMGGRVEVLGNRVALTDNAGIDASGSNGGGQILVGGDQHGNNAAIQNASTTYFGTAARLSADATRVGAGGTVIVWAENTTRAAGNISAGGGLNGGNGGFVQVSGRSFLDFSSHVDTRAPLGSTGTLLLDPTNITIAKSSPTFDGGSMLTSANIKVAPNRLETLIGKPLKILGRTLKVLRRTEQTPPSSQGGPNPAGSPVTLSSPTLSLTAAPPAVATTSIADTTSSSPRGGALSVGRINTVGLVDGAVTVRLSLVEAAPIALR